MSSLVSPDSFDDCPVTYWSLQWVLLPTPAGGTVLLFLSLKQPKGVSHFLGVMRPLLSMVPNPGDTRKCLESSFKASPPELHPRKTRFCRSARWSATFLENRIFLYRLKSSKDQEWGELKTSATVFWAVREGFTGQKNFPLSQAGPIKGFICGVQMVTSWGHLWSFLDVILCVCVCVCIHPTPPFPVA